MRHTWQHLRYPHIVFAYSRFLELLKFYTIMDRFDTIVCHAPVIVDDTKPGLPVDEVQCFELPLLYDVAWYVLPLSYVRICPLMFKLYVPLLGLMSSVCPTVSI